MLKCSKQGNSQFSFPIYKQASEYIPNTMCCAQDKRSKTIPLDTIKSTGDKIYSHPVELI